MNNIRRLENHVGYSMQIKGQRTTAPQQGIESAEAWVNPEYFHLNSGGMARYCEAMRELGMVHQSTCPVRQHEWPEDDGHNEDAYWLASDAITSRHGDSADPTIPLHKFSSNDGWLVTPDEISAALKVWDSLDENARQSLSDTTQDLIADPYWDEWIEFLRLAAQHEGFRVH